MRPIPAVLPYALVLALAACGAQPAPGMFGAKRVQVTRGGHEYVVLRKDRRVEVIRLGYARRGEHHAIRETMVRLIAEATGCRPYALQGDSGEMHGRLACSQSLGGASPPLPG